jgi:hypothetical protein
MRKLPLIFGLLLLFGAGFYLQNPHGENLKFDCSDCHTSEGWTFSASTAVFSHDSTSFILEGQHIYTNCRACHSNLIFSEAKSNCMDCHTDMHNNTVGLDCARCHSPKSWLVTNITEIHQLSRFPLLGAHNTADCIACHVSASNLEFQPLGVECVDCHRQDYMATTNPNHVQSGISTDCMDCHRIDAFEWTSKGFNHDFFPLTLGHDLTDCKSCHTAGLFEPVESECFLCHQQNFLASTNPPHQNLGFSTDCQNCHTTSPGWEPALIPNHQDFFVLNGAHARIAENCFLCHQGNYTQTPNTCYGCHSNEYNQTANPSHSAAQFPADCENCHSETAWKPSTFNHDAQFFPIYSGRHREEWNACADCHTTPANFQIFSCVDCHEHNRTEADKEHREVNGYAYNSISCFTCHPLGTAEDD